MQAELGHEVHSCSLVREPTAPSDRNGVRVQPLAARNPLWITESAKYPSPLRLANKAATVLNHCVASEFAALLDDIKPDVLHTHSMVELPPAVWDRAARRGVPIVHTLHDYDLLCIRGALFKDGRKCRPRHLACRMLAAPKRTMHDRIDAVAAVSRAVLDTHLDHGLFAHLPPERRQVAWNPAKLAQSSPPHRPRAAGEAMRFGFLGRVTAEKGLGPLLAACRALPAQGWTLRIAGEGSERPGFEAQARDLPVRFDGYVDAASFLAEIDVLICAPLWDEPFGLTTIEAYAAGCRVIGSAAGVIGEVIERVDPGWSVPPGDAPALAAAMQRAIAQGSALPVDNQPAVRSLLAELAPACVTQTYLDLYNTVQPRTFAPLAANG
jgi:glycosyltransferase involved in cell wall biosynthesis